MVSALNNYSSAGLVFKPLKERVMTSEDRAFFLAPLAMPFAVVLFTLFTDVPGLNMEAGFFSYLVSVFVITLVGLPVVYTFEFFLGYRFYRLFLKKGQINVFTLILGGVLLADIPMFMIGIFGGFSDESHNLSTAFPLFSFVGFSIGLTFWALLNKDRIVQAIKK